MTKYYRPARLAGRLLRCDTEYGTPHVIYPPGFVKCLVRDYLQGMPWHELSHKYKMTTSAISRLFRKLGVPERRHQLARIRDIAERMRKENRL